MATIVIEDLPAIEQLTEEEMASLFGAGKKFAKRSNRFLSLENLERREVMATQIQAIYNGVELAIIGTDNPDTIKLHQVNHRVSIENASIRSVSGQNVSSVDASGIGKIRISGLQSDDTIQIGDASNLAEERISIPTTIYGGAGSDTLIGDAATNIRFDEDGIDALFGGSDSAPLFARHLDEFLIGNNPISTDTTGPTLTVSQTDPSFFGYVTVKGKVFCLTRNWNFPPVGLA